MLVESQMASGTWTDPERGKVKVSDYAATWIIERPGLRPRTVDLYRYLLEKHVIPYIGGTQIGKVSPALVREWRAKLLENGVSVAAKAYRLLRAVMTTAVEDDGILSKNPCRIRGRERGPTALTTGDSVRSCRWPRSRVCGGARLPR